MTRRNRATCPDCINAPEGQKHCHGECDKVKMLDEFYNSKDSADGKTSRCRECTKEANRDYGRDKRAEDPNYFYDYHKNWITVNGRDRYSEYETSRNSTPERKSYIKENTAQWRAEHPDEVRSYGMKRRAQKYATRTEPILRSVVAERDNWTCLAEVCYHPDGRTIDPNGTFRLEDGSFNPWYLNIDHYIPLSKDGTDTYDNVMATHAKCNLHKNASMPEGVNAVSGVVIHDEEDIGMRVLEILKTLGDGILNKGAE